MITRPGFPPTYETTLPPASPSMVMPTGPGGGAVNTIATRTGSEKPAPVVSEVG